MADEIDKATEKYDLIHDANLAAVRARAAMIPEGSPGECLSCGLESKRLVNDLCAPCRDDLERVGR